LLLLSVEYSYPCGPPLSEFSKILLACTGSICAISTSSKPISTPLPDWKVLFFFRNSSLLYLLLIAAGLSSNINSSSSPWSPSTSDWVFFLKRAFFISEQKAITQQARIRVAIIPAKTIIPLETF
jgi:hypothetical protein